MDLTPQTLREVEFREKLRGYHPDDVDDFLEEVAVAVDALLGRVRAAEAAAAGHPLPAPVSAPADPNLNEGTLSRALLLAQRTADLAIAEAEESAQRLRDEARIESDRVLAETNTKVAIMTQEAKAAAEAAVTELEQRRIGLEREVVALQAWAAQHRDRLREVLGDQLRALDIWLTTSAVAPPSSRLATPPTAPARPTMPIAGEPTAPIALEAVTDQPAPAEGSGPTGASFADAATAEPGRAAPDGDGAATAVYRPPADASGGDIGAASPGGAGPAGAGPAGAGPAGAGSTGAVAMGPGVVSGRGLAGPAAGDGAWRTGGGGDGVVLFDQDGQAFDDGGDDGARMAGRYFRRR